MLYDVLFIVLSIILLPRNVNSFEFIRDIVFPRTPIVDRYRRVDVARTLGDDFAVLDTVGLVEQHGYPAEEHKVTTDDGYNLVFFRIPGSPKSPPMKKKPVVFIQHGVLGSSDHWVLMGPEHDLAFLLADEGYDVWLGNIRGNTYTRSHTSLSPLDKEFWNFSFHEMATLDLPKMIDYALETSGQKTLIYIGHSMGTTMSYILLSEIPEYNDRMRLVVSLAPIAVWKQLPNAVIRLAIDSALVIKRILDDAGVYDIAPQTRNNIRVGRALCNDKTIAQNVCTTLYFSFAGTDPEQLNSTLLPYYLSYYPAGASTKTLYHFQQIAKSGIFQQYDFGEIENTRTYGKKKAPIYNLKKISAPIALIYAKNDALSLEPNVVELERKLEKVVTMEAVPFDSFNHMDFLWAIDGKDLLYNRIIELVSMYSK